jgi:hypothetical protein
MNKRKSVLIAAIGLGGVAIFGVTALATPGVGFSGSPNPALRGTLTHDVQLNSDRSRRQLRLAYSPRVRTCGCGVGVRNSDGRLREQYVFGRASLYRDGHHSDYRSQCE